MNCPYCNKRIEGMTGLMEATKFQKHLRKCRKNPNYRVLPARVNDDGFYEPSVNLTCSDLKEAIELRAASGQ